jgi:uncharacterized protein YyaL (SSP411 family)
MRNRPHGDAQRSNRLIDETSPYLLAHAHDPVDWFPWGEEAFARAVAENKPIHLSVGYNACHWCRVLHTESFEDQETADILNSHFVNIKVDREERPDIDRIYQIAQQMLTQRSGGWPLTMFLTPDDQKPFFGGTYFPKESRFGLPAFKDLLKRVAQYYREQENDLRQQNVALIQALDSLNPPAAEAGTELTGAPLVACRVQLQRTFDAQSGGFGAAPKFPHPRNVERLLRDWHATAATESPDLQALYMATLTLRRMGEGGLNDQLAGGFYRYSVDAQWMIPHFEKMLYDNGELLAAYAQAAAATGDAFYRSIVERTTEWALSEMRSPEGAFYSSLDADSEGHEGKFYVWEPEEVRRALDADEYAAFAPRYGLDREPNFEGRHWHLHAFQPLDEGSEARIESARRKLLEARAARVRPARDDKILTSWNALMIRGLAMGARHLAIPDLEAAATRALRFVRETLWREGRLLATYKDGRAHLNAYLDDYAYLADAILELQQVRFRADELAFARELIEVVLAHHADAEAGGFYFTSDDHEQLIHRSKSFSDDATPAGNGVAAFVLQRMGYLLGEPRYLEAAERTLRSAWKVVEQYPHAHASLLAALEELLHPTDIVILRGDAAVVEEWRAELAKVYAPRRMLLAIPTDTPGLPEALASKPAKGECCGYVCRGSTCSAPHESLSTLIEELRSAPV